jgi:hypothetical protein
VTLDIGRGHDAVAELLVNAGFDRVAVHLQDLVQPVQHVVRRDRRVGLPFDRWPLNRGDDFILGHVEGGTRRPRLDLAVVTGPEQ